MLFSFHVQRPSASVSFQKLISKLEFRARRSFASLFSRDVLMSIVVVFLPSAGGASVDRNLNLTIL